MYELNEKASVTMWRKSFLNLLVAVHRSPMRVYDTRIVARYVTPTKENRAGVEYDEKQVPNNFHRVVDEIARQTNLTSAVRAILKSDRQKRLALTDAKDDGADLIDYVVDFGDDETETVTAFNDTEAEILAKARRIEKREPYGVISVTKEEDIRLAEVK